MSSRLQGFVKGDQPQESQSFPQQMRTDRVAHAQGLKIRPGPAKSAHKAAATAPASASTTTSTRFAARTSYDTQQQPFTGDSTFPAPTQEPPQNSQYDGHNQKAPRGLADDDTIGSDFDKTATVSDFQGNQQYAENEDEYEDDNEAEHQVGFQQGEHGPQLHGNQQAMDYSQRSLHHMPGHQELNRLSQEQIGASRTVILSGRNRFAQSQPAPQHSPLPNRAHSVNGTTEYDSRSRKRTHSAGNQHFNEGYQHEPEERFIDGQSEMSESTQSSPRPMNNGSHRVQHSQQHEGENSPSQKSFDHLPDYTDVQLKGKKYEDLANESREHVPGQKRLILPKELQGPQVPLSKKVDYYVQEHAGVQDTDRDEGPYDSRLFFAQLSTKEWDEAGDIFVERFADLMKQIKTKRTEKRQAMEKFEKEIEKREKAVRGKSENLDRKFEGMRASGEHVLRGKTS